MFSGVTATGQYAWAPSLGAVGANEVDLGTSNVGLEGADLEEESGDSEENVNKDFENHTSRGVVGVQMSNSSNTKSSGKRKEREHPELRDRKKKSSGIGAQLVSIQQQLLDSMSSRSIPLLRIGICRVAVFVKYWLSSNQYLVRQMTMNFLTELLRS